MRLRLPRLSYANVAATLALLIALVGAGGGDAIAAAVKKLAPNSVTTKAIRNGAVTGAKVKARSLTSANIAVGSIGGTEVKDGSLGGADIADGSLGGQDLAPRSVGADRLALGTVGTAEIADHTITNNDLGPGAITSANIGPKTINGSNIAPETIAYGNLDPAAVEQLTNQWNAGAISKGSTLTGYAAIAYVPGLDPADSQGVQHPEVRSISVSFPQRVTDLLAVKFAGDTACPGSWENPTASTVLDSKGEKRGVVCLYARPGSTNLGTVDVLDQSDFGFALLVHPTQANAWTAAQYTWAFSRPSA